MRERRFINRTTPCDREFYKSNAASCGKEAHLYVAKGNEFLAGWFAKRAASYVLDSALWIVRPDNAKT